MVLSPILNSVMSGITWDNLGYTTATMDITWFDQSERRLLCLPRPHRDGNCRLQTCFGAEFLVVFETLVTHDFPHNLVLNVEQPHGKVLVSIPAVHICRSKHMINPSWMASATLLWRSVFMLVGSKSTRFKRAIISFSSSTVHGPNIQQIMSSSSPSLSFSLRFVPHTLLSATRVMQRRGAAGASIPNARTCKRRTYARLHTRAPSHTRARTHSRTQAQLENSLTCLITAASTTSRCRAQHSPWASFTSGARHLHGA